MNFFVQILYDELYPSYVTTVLMNYRFSKTGIPSDIVIEVEGQMFHLHKVDILQSWYILLSVIESFSLNSLIFFSFKY